MLDREPEAIEGKRAITLGDEQYEPGPRRPADGELGPLGAGISAAHSSAIAARSTRPRRAPRGAKPTVVGFEWDIAPGRKSLPPIVKG